jgi:poly(3-hydroxybutyrate) depolymerase
MPILPNGNCSKKSSPQVKGRHLLPLFMLVILSLVAVAGSSLALCGTAVAPEAKISKARLVSSGKAHNYSLFVPESVSSGSPAPLILLLHGSGRDGMSQVERWKELAAREGIILAGPDAITPMAWRMPVDGPVFLRDLVNELSSKFPVDPRRVYLWGHSAGAEFALKMGLLESEYFAAVAIHAGALAPDEYKLTDYATRKIPMSVFVGTRDPIFPLALVRGTVAALNARGIVTRLNEIEGHDHNYYPRATQINRAAWDFLKEQKLSAAPRFTEYNTRSSE